MKRYELLSGEVVHLAGLSAREQAFLKNLQRIARSDIGYFEIERLAIGPGSPALQGWSRVTPEIVSSALYQAARDITTRAGIAEGLILAPQHENIRSRIPTDRSMMSVTQASLALGISRAAVHKAIQQKRLAAQRYGNVVLVSRQDVARYKRDRAKGRGALIEITNRSWTSYRKKGGVSSEEARRRLGLDKPARKSRRKTR
jgi:excisionase family DNA binding protein